MDFNSPNKRFKTLIPSLDPKGKSLPNRDDYQKEFSDNCGICLSEATNGGVSRGFIDSCNHYFCFVCIMEWAKVETKCPLCKRRFSTIRRPPKPPLFPSERVVHVPVRDQVYYYFGNATVGSPDPYSELKCSVCHSIADEHLLLLCDLCDSGAHTYCIGLGYTVPEGDWFCHECALLRDENLERETDTDTEPKKKISLSTDQNLSSANEHVSIFDIVPEPGDDVVQTPPSTSSDQRNLPAPSATQDGISMRNYINNLSSARLGNLALHRPKPNTRTLQICHNVRDRIRVLRENWNGFQNGTLPFSSSEGDGSSSTQKSVSSVRIQNTAPYSNEQSTTQSNSSNIGNGYGADEILRAWKMMEKAKSIKQGGKKSSVVRQAEKCPKVKLDPHKESGSTMSSRHLNPSSQHIRSSDAEPHHRIHYGPHGNGYSNELSPMSGKQKCGKPMIIAVANRHGSSRDSHLTAHQEVASSKCAQTPLHLHNARIRTDEKPPAEESFKLLSGSVPSVMSETLDSKIGHVKHLKKKSHLEKVCANSKQHQDAKSEIQSLVKLNLKLQMKDQKLEVDAFKEVARIATHSILAACGLEQPKPGHCSVSGSICSHPSEVWHPQRSSLLPNCCRECFYVFVKDMVTTVMLQKKSMWDKSKGSLSQTTGDRML